MIVVDTSDGSPLCGSSWIAAPALPGERFGPGVLLIGAVAAEAGALIWSLDSGFVRMERAGLVALYQP